MDLVYPLSPGPLDYSELKYSLRTIEKNLGAERVHFFGGKPNWLRTDLYTRTDQPHDKWKNARIQMRAALDSDAVSDPFVWMNDDIYLLAPVKELPMWHGGDYAKWLGDLGPRYAVSAYVRDGRRTIKVLTDRGLPSVCWSLHTPIVISKAAMDVALAVDAKHGQSLHLRTLYANIAGLEGELAPVRDVKSQLAPKYLYASSSNATWQRSPLGRHIRNIYATPSRWEKR